jgi:hypothetical protein
VKVSQIFFRSTLWLSLGVWVGSWGFFAFVVSRLAFRVLPGNVAGDLAGQLLQPLHYGGATLALVAAASAVALGRRGLVVALPLLLAAICLASELFLSPEVAALRPSAMGAEATEAKSLRFKYLHALSLGTFLVVHIASIGLLVLHARIDAGSLVEKSSSG